MNRERALKAVLVLRLQREIRAYRGQSCEGVSAR